MSHLQISRIYETWSNKFTFSYLGQIPHAGRCEPPPNAQENCYISMGYRVHCNSIIKLPESLPIDTPSFEYSWYKLYQSYEPVIKISLSGFSTKHALSRLLQATITHKSLNFYSFYNIYYVVTFGAQTILPPSDGIWRNKSGSILNNWSMG